MKVIRACYEVLKKRLQEQIPDLGVGYGTGDEAKETREPLYQIPAARLYFFPVEVIALSGGLDRLKSSLLQVTVVTESLDDTDQSIEDHFELTEQVYRALKGYYATYGDWEGSSNKEVLVNTIRLVRMIPDHAPTNLMATSLEFSLTMHNRTAIETRTPVTPKPVVEGSYA